MGLMRLLRRSMQQRRTGTWIEWAAQRASIGARRRRIAVRRGPNEAQTQAGLPGFGKKRADRLAPDEPLPERRQCDGRVRFLTLHKSPDPILTCRALSYKDGCADTPAQLA